MVGQKEIVKAFRNLQDNICSGLEKLDGTGKFQEDLWDRPEGGGGRSRVISGSLIERGGVNFSEVYGPLHPKAAAALKMSGGNFFATGVSIVLHPKNPWVPIIHMNVRYFELDESIWWFGGGIDLTPHYVDEKDAQSFHQYLKNTCDTLGPEYYQQFKEYADNYFYLAHRKETRGVGGIFYDRLNGETGFDKNRLKDFSLAVGNSFVPAFAEVANRQRDKAYGEKELQWQSLRRGRYVEFNLVWDRGTKFGLETGGRTESILMSMPPQANWLYNYTPEEGSLESKTLAQLKKGINWAKI